MQVRCALVGMPGSGKSTVGKQLAQRLGVPFIDLDHQLELVLKTSIRNFFETEGEARFRDLEAQVLADTTAQAGGRPDSRNRLTRCAGRAAVTAISSTVNSASRR